jgi:hypothetical protein
MTRVIRPEAPYMKKTISSIPNKSNIEKMKSWKKKPFNKRI